MTCLTAHTYTHTCTARSNPLFSPNVQYSRIPSALRRWWRAKKNSNNKKWCGAVSHSLMTSPQSYAALIFPLLHVHHTHTQWDTHTHRERKALSSSFTSPAASAAPAYTHNLGHVQGRHNTSHHSSTQAKFRTGPMCSHKPREMHFCKQKRTPTLQYWTKNNNPPSKSLNHKKPRSYSDTFRPWELIVTAIWELEKERTREDLIPGF